MEHRGSISIPYEISIPKSDIPLRTCPDYDDYGPEDLGVPPPSRSSLYETPRMDPTSASRLSSHRSAFSLLSPSEVTSNTTTSYDNESGFESSCSSSGNTTAAAAAASSLSSWRSQTYGPPLLDDNLPDMRNVTTRNVTMRNRASPSPASVDPCARGKTSPLATGDYGVGGGGGGGSDDEAAVWKAYRARSILDAEETGNGRMGAGCGVTAPKGAKASPAEVRHGDAVCQNINMRAFLTRVHIFGILMQHKKFKKKWH